MNENNRKRRFLKQEEIKLILKLLKYFEKTSTLEEAIHQTHLATKIPTKAICGIIKKHKKVAADKKKDLNVLSPNFIEFNNNEVFNIQSGIRRKIQNLLIQKQQPTLQKLLDDINSDTNLPNFTKLDLIQELYEMNYKFENYGNRCLLIENEETIKLRRQYLRNLFKYRLTARKKVYVNHTIINIDKSKLKLHESLNSYDENHKPPRITLIYNDISHSFIAGAEIKFTLSKTNITNDVDEELFEKWFIDILLPNLNDSSVIILDSAKNNTKLIDNIPSLNWPRKDLIQLLHKQNINYRADMLKIELLELLKTTSNENHYKLNEIATKAGHHLLRIPPKHYELNPIYMVWKRLATFITIYIKPDHDFKSLQELIQNAYVEIANKCWSKYLNDVQTIEKRMWIADEIQDNLVEMIVID